MERDKDAPMHILEIADGVRKLADVDNPRFRYYKNFKSNPLDEESLANFSIRCTSIRKSNNRNTS